MELETRSLELGTSRRRETASSHPSSLSPAFALLLYGLLASATPLSAGAQEAVSLPLVGDVAKVKGVDENVFVGTGLVVGLNGTGDKSPSTADVARYLLKDLGNQIPESRFKSKNIALVTVTVRIPAFKKRGDRVDVEVQAVNDATSLAGGTLLPTPLQGPGGGAAGARPVIALAQGPVSIGNVQRGAHATIGQIPSGAVVVRELEHRFLDTGRVLLVPDAAMGLRGLLGRIRETEELRSVSFTVRDETSLEAAVPPEHQESSRAFIALLERVLGGSARVVGVGRVQWSLDSPSFEAADKISQEVNQRWRPLCPRLAAAKDAGTIEVYVPREYLDDPVSFVAQVQAYPAPVVASENRVVVDEKNGTIGVTGDVWVDPGWIELGEIEISIPHPRRLTEVLADVKRLRVSGPRPLPGRSAESSILSTRDLIVAIQKMKQAGMLRAKLVVE